MEEETYNCLIPRCLLVVLIVVQALLIIYYGNEKQGFIMDEYYTWMSANSYDNPEFKVPIGHWTDTEFLKEYFTVQEGEQFAYPAVWNNLKADVHPPLYSWVLHTICSFFTNYLSKWFGLCLNLAYAILISILVYLTAKDITGNCYVGLAATLLYSLSNWAISSAMYIRMYQQLVLMISWSCFWHVRNIEVCDLKKSAYIQLGIITVLGAITHYHFLIFAFFEALFYCISKMAKKDKSNVWKYILVMGISAVISVLIFPPMIRDIFFGYRGTEAFSNLIKGDGYMYTLSSIWNMIDNRLLAGIPIWIIVLMIAMALFEVVKKYSNYDKVRVFLKLGIVLTPTMGFALLVAKTAPYLTDRYYFGIGPVFAVFIVCILSIIINNLIKIRFKRWLTLIISFLLSITTLYTANINYLNDFINDQRKSIQDTECSNYLYIIDKNTWKVMDNINVLWDMEQIYFTEENQISGIQGENMNEDVLLLGIVSDNTTGIVDKLKQIYGYNNAQYICRNGDTVTFCLTK